MKLLQQILNESGADLGNSFTVIPFFGGYFKSVKKIMDYTPQKIVLTVAKKRLTVVGEKLTVEKYFQQDLFIKGDIAGVTLE